MVKYPKIPERFWSVKQINIFRDLVEADADSLAQITSFETLKYGETFSAEAVYLLKEGRVKIHRTPPEGESVTLDVLEPGEFFGAVKWEDTDTHPNVIAETLTDSVIGVVAAKHFHYFLKRKPHLAMPLPWRPGPWIKKWFPRYAAAPKKFNIISAARNARRGMTNPFLNIAFRTPASRLALLLQNCVDSKPQGGRGAQKLSTKRLAHLIGASVENVETVLKQFKHHGIIEKQYRRIHILDPWHLKKIATAKMQTLPPETLKIQENSQTYEQEEPLFATRPADGR